MTKYVLIPAHYKKQISLTDKALEKVSQYKKVALFAAVQFILLDDVEKQLADAGIEILNTHGKRTSGKYQILGCDCHHDSFEMKNIFEEADAILYIGDGLFHPKALVLAQMHAENPKEVILFDPINDTVRTIDQEDIMKPKKKYKANILRYMQSERIGVLVSTKTGQQYLKNAIKLKERLKGEKEVMIFIDDTFNYALMENYPFIECWVNTACPRIGYDDVCHMPKPLININDALNPNDALVKFA